MLRDWSADEVRALVERHPALFTGLEGAPLTRLGSGESYAAWRIGELVIRIARRPVSELPAAPAEELAGLALAPAGLAPRAAGSGEVVWSGHPFPVLVQDFVPGRLLPAAQWDEGLRARLVEDLARLHERTWLGAGPVSTAEGNAAARPDFAAEVEGVIAWWEPRLAAGEAAIWRPLVEPMRAYAAEVAPVLAELTEFSLIHGDACLTNILVDQGLPRLIDWEWTSIGDPARDLAFLGGAVHAPPWYAPVGDDEIGRLLRRYLDAGGRGELDGLRTRRDARLALEGFSVVAHLLWVVATHPEQDPAWRPATARELLRSLTDYLRPFGAR